MSRQLYIRLLFLVVLSMTIASCQEDEESESVTESISIPEDEVVTIPFNQADASAVNSNFIQSLQLYGKENIGIRGFTSVDNDSRIISGSFHPEKGWTCKSLNTSNSNSDFFVPTDNYGNEHSIFTRTSQFNNFSELVCWDEQCGELWTFNYSQQLAIYQNSISLSASIVRCIQHENKTYIFGGYTRSFPNYGTWVIVIDEEGELVKSDTIDGVYGVNPFIVNEKIMVVGNRYTGGVGVMSIGLDMDRSSRNVHELPETFNWSFLNVTEDEKIYVYTNVSFNPLVMEIKKYSATGSLEDVNNVQSDRSDLFVQFNHVDTEGNLYMAGAVSEIGNTTGVYIAKYSSNGSLIKAKYLNDNRSFITSINAVFPSTGGKVSLLGRHVPSGSSNGSEFVYIFTTQL